MITVATFARAVQFWMTSCSAYQTGLLETKCPCSIPGTHEPHGAHALLSIPRNIVAC